MSEPLPHPPLGPWVACALEDAWASPHYVGEFWLDKQETPEVPASEASTDRTTLLEVPGGCSPECA